MGQTEVHRQFCNKPINPSALGLLTAYMIDFCWKCPRYHSMECTSHCVERILMYDVLSEISKDLTPTPIGFIGKNIILPLSRLTESPYSFNNIN